MTRLQWDKLLVAATLTLWISAPYYALQRWQVFPARAMKPTRLDHLIPFDDAAVWLYLSLYILLPLALWLIREREDVWRAARGIAVIAAISHLLFFVIPTYMPLPRPMSGEFNFLYRWMTTMDGPFNACPSLHASLGVFAALWCQRLLQTKWYTVVVWLWTLSILVSTLVTKQHVVWDLVAGTLLGAGVYYAGALVRQEGVSTEPPSEELQSTVKARAALSLGLETELQALRRFEVKHRWFELAFFSILLICGVLLTTAGRSAAGFMRYALLVSGIAISALSINTFVLLLHEGMHHTLFASSGWNRWVAVLLGTTFLMSFSAYQVMHTRHHDFLGDPRDPDDYHNYSSNRSLVWALHFVRLTVGPLLYIFLIPILACKHGTLRQRRRIAMEYLLLIALYSMVVMVAPLSWLLYVWLLPLLLVGQMTAIRGFTQHGIADASDPYLASRSIRARPLVAFFLLNENYHLEHHLFPDVPSYNLRRLHELLWPRLPYAVTGTSYLVFLFSFFRATLVLDETPIGLTATEKDG